MGARKKYPEFDNFTAEDVAALLSMSKLSSQQCEVAMQCIVKQRTMIDAGEAAGGYCRSTVSRWMREDILPELHRMMHRMDFENKTAGLLSDAPELTKNNTRADI